MTHPIILAAIGELPQDEAVLARAQEISRQCRADLHVVHILDLPGQDAVLADITTLPGQAAFAVQNRIEVALSALGADMSKVTIRLEMGSPSLRLLDVCTDLSPDVIVMRAHQKMTFTEKLLGSTTDRVIAAADTPVLVVKRKAERDYRRVVVATDGTDRGSDMAALVSRILPATKLHLVQSVEIPPQLKEAMLRVGTPKAELAQHKKVLTKAAQDHLRDVASNSAHQTTTQVLKGNASKTLTRLSRTKDVDLLVLGQGRTNLVKRAFIGSVSRRLLRDAGCDVLIY